MAARLEPHQKLVELGLVRRVTDSADELLFISHG